MLPSILHWDFDAVARFAIGRYLAALRALQARPEPAGGAIIDPAELRALVADLKREGERSLSGDMHIAFRSPPAAPGTADAVIEPLEIEPLEVEP